MPDHVVWLPLNSPGSAVHRQLGVTPGAVVKIGAAQVMTGFGHDTWWLILAKSLLVFVFLVLTVLIAILAERKILGRMQMRWGPNRVGPRGYLQSLADGIKLALKEPIIPFGVEKPIFLTGTGHLDDSRDHGVRVHPVRAAGFGVRPLDPAAGDRPAGGGAVHPGARRRSGSTASCWRGGRRARPIRCWAACARPRR